eukprot:TRINITY_DN25043_c0_g1_i1.p1 TRINITY_DN25043_c0_g1~~TRINITY_DN25043_c0_g1_i1.p1  ORF type:complete len:433 (+),score=98.68 TRINITY_DN25043_c0_g1_i1:209-1507(+)
MAVLVPAEAPHYLFQGQRLSYHELEARRALQSEAASPGSTLRCVADLLADSARREALVEALFDEYAGEDARLQQEEVVGLLVSLGAQVGIPDALSLFGEVSHMFYRFDFSGTDYLTLQETRSLTLCVLRDLLERLSPPRTGMKLVNLERKSLHESFDVLKKLGQGGQGAVWLAKDRATGHERVVKCYSKADVNAPLEDIKDEFALLKKLDHPHVARVRQAFEDLSNVYVVSEPYYGGDLTTLVVKASEHGVVVSFDWVARVFAQVLGGVEFLHASLVMHCDLKEPNVMVVDDSDASWLHPRVVIIDFGMARSFSGQRSGGTPGYQPPEVWSHGLWMARGDIFSLGVMFWSIYNGSPGGPFLVDDLPPYDRIRERTYNAEVDCGRMPSNLASLTQQMLHKNFRKRPTAAQVLMDELFLSLLYNASFSEDGVVL